MINGGPGPLNPLWVCSGVALLLGLLSVLGSWWQARRCLASTRCLELRLLQEAREEIERATRETRLVVEAELQALEQQLSFLETSQQKSEEAARRGLGRSLRGQAMQLLRSGQAPSTVASSLGLPVREVRLVARVARIVSSQ